MAVLRNLAGDRVGATAIEYGLIAGLIAMAIVVAMTLVSADLGALFTDIAGDLSAATPSS